MNVSRSSQPMSPFAYAVIEPQAAGQFLATSVGWPVVQAQGNSRQQALSNLRRLVRQRLDQVEIVPLALNLPDGSATHPWSQFAGLFADDPQFDQVVDEVTAYRQHLDASEDASV